MWAVCSVHTGRPWVSVSTHRTSVCVRQHTQDVRGCPSVSVSTHRILSISTHISMLVLGLSMLTLPVDCSGDFGRRRLSGQYTQDVRGCPPAHTGRQWLSVCVRVCSSVSFSTHRTQHAGPSRVHRTSVGVRQHTHDVCGFLWLSVSTHRTSVAVCVCPCVSVGVRQHTQDVCGCLWLSGSTNRTSVCVRQHTQDVCVCLSAHTGRPWLSICTHISTLVLGLRMLALSVDGSGDFGPRGLSIQYTQDGRGCPSAHKERLWVFVSTHRTSVAVSVCPCVSVCVRQNTHDVCGCPSVHISACWLSVQYTQDIRGCPSAVSTHRTSVGVRQHTQDVRVCPSAHTGRPGLSVCVRMCPSAHTGRPTSVGVRQHTQDVCACPCLSVCDRQHTQDVRVCPSVHISTRCTHRTSVGVRQRTQDVCGCLWLSVSTHRTSVAVRVCPCVTHGTSVAVHQYTYQHAGPWTQHAGPSRGLFGISVCVRQHTQDIRGCPCVSVCVRQHTQDVRGCPSVHISAHWSLDSARLPFPWTVRVILSLLGCLLSTHRTSVGVR
ncbi:hypothetical protein YC2023_108570 [Brassica napus]